MNDDAAWSELLAEVGGYMETLFAISSRRDKEVWQYIVGVGAHLEYAGVIILWLADGRPTSFKEFAKPWTLGRASKEIKHRQLLDDTSTSAMNDIAVLRNGLVHAGAVFGVTTDDERERGYYRGRHVFTELEAFRQLTKDGDAAITASFTWIKAHPAVTRPTNPS